MTDKLNKDNRGFTIIEVLIVLAIAGLIMLIVFLAVPALQRNQRNNARNNDASRISAAVTECLANRNGVVASCNTAGAIQITADSMARLEAPTFPAAAGYSQTTPNVVFGFQCNPAGSAAVAGGGSRAFVVTYQLEPDINRCIAS